MKIKFNNEDECLYCVECKNIIHIGEKYSIVTETVLDEKIRKEYHLECTPVDEDEVNGLLDEYSENPSYIEEYDDE